MKCPRDGSTLKKLRMSYVCPRCDYKVIQPNKKVYPELNHTVVTPENIVWSSYTLTNCTLTAGVISMDSGQLSATIVSPQLANLTRNESTGMRRDITKVLYKKLIASNNGGRIRLHASNDGSTRWLRIKDDKQEWRLNDGHEGDFGGTYQKKYSDLRLKFTLTRSSASDTSPTVTSFILEHNYLPEDKKVKSRDNVNDLIMGK